MAKTVIGVHLDGSTGEVPTYYGSRVRFLLRPFEASRPPRHAPNEIVTRRKASKALGKVVSVYWSFKHECWGYQVEVEQPGRLNVSYVTALQKYLRAT